MNTPELGKYDPARLEPRWVQAWAEGGYFTANAASAKPPFCMVMPPPNVTGALHIGHALTATIEDILVRWKRMSGFEALWVPGIDHAGIATQMLVERDLQAREGKSRFDLGRDEFLMRVWEWKAKYGQRIGEQHRVMGASADWSRERFTLDPGMLVAVREAFLRLYDAKLIYRAQRLIHWDAQLLTALSDLEVDNEERDGFLWEIAYPVVDSSERIVIATTRPESIPADAAVAVHPDDPRYQHLIGKKVHLPLTLRQIPIIADAELVDMNFGTGALKVTPAHDHQDYQVALRHGLPMINLFTDFAVVNENGGKYAGLDRFIARDRMIEDLTSQGLMVGVKPYRVPLAISQRSGTVVEPRLSWQWFLNVKTLAEAATRAVERGEVRFVPEYWTNSFYTWMNNIHDWCISRQLWWGHRIPAWYRASVDGTVDFASSECVVGKEPPTDGVWVQDPDVLDTWFSSGLWPFSTLGWPEKTADFDRFYPNTVMETGHDILFFWVARMMMLGIQLTGKAPFSTVYLHAMVRDEKGEKMSKTKGNVLDPLAIVQGAAVEDLPPSIQKKYPDGLGAQGADALRLTLAMLTQQGREVRLSMERIVGSKAFCNKLWNATRFALLHVGTQRHQGRVSPSGLFERWILSRLNRTVKEVQRALEAYDFASAATSAYQFTWGELCDWYIELSKLSLTGDDPIAKGEAQRVLVECLDGTLRLLHPFIPFITEELWHHLPIERTVPSISLAEFPVADEERIDATAEAEMAPILAAISAIRSMRGESIINPNERLTAVVFSPEASIRKTLTKHEPSVKALAGLRQLDVRGSGTAPPFAAAEVLAQMEIFLPLAGVVDLADERARVEKELLRIDTERYGLAKKFANPNFVARAPAEVVEKDRAREAELLARRTKLERHLGRLAQPTAAELPPRLAKVRTASPRSRKSTPAPRASKPARIRDKVAKKRAKRPSVPRPALSRKASEKVASRGTKAKRELAPSPKKGPSKVATIKRNTTSKVGRRRT